MVACSGLIFPKDISGLGKAVKVIDSLAQETGMGTKEMLSSAESQNADIFKKNIYSVS